MKGRSIEVCVRAIIEQGGNLLVCRHQKRNYYFLPGGHVEFGESAESALKREIKEELGVAPIQISLMGLVENKFSEDGTRHHEVNLIFKVKLPSASWRSKEDHLEFVLIDKKNLSGAKVLPLHLKRALLLWFKDKQFFWINS